MLYALILLALGAALAACGGTAPAQPAPAGDGAQGAQGEAAQAQPTEQAAAPAQPDAGAGDTGEAAVSCDGSPTPAQTEGPYYTPGSPERANLLEDDPAGTPLVVTGYVLDTDCQPIAGAVVDFWQTDSAGNYDNAGYGMRGHLAADADGRYQLLTVIPGEYPGRTPHIHVKVFDPDGTELLTTQLYLVGISDKVPDGIYDAALLARDLPPDAEGRKQVAFDFVVRTAS